MMRQSEYAARAQDKARTKFSNRSLATGRRSRPTDTTQLHAEQDDYRRRFGNTTQHPQPTIVDTDGNYPDTNWTRRR